MNHCRIVQDLLPLYVDNTCAPGSREYVEEHVQFCPECKELLDSMKQVINVKVPQPNAKKSFSHFSHRLIGRRVFLITTCILAALLSLTVALWSPVINPYLFEPLKFPSEDIDLQLSQLSDGSIYVRFTYTGDEYCVGGNGFEGDKEGSFKLGIQHSRFHDFIKIHDQKTFDRILCTAQSEYVYQHTMAPAVSLTLICSDGDHVIWELGDELPPADAEAEALLQQYIENGYFIPMEEWRKKMDSGELEFAFASKEEAFA